VRSGKVVGKDLAFLAILTKKKYPSYNPDKVAHDILGGGTMGTTKYTAKGCQGMHPRCVAKKLLYLCNINIAQNLEALQRSGVTHIVNLSGFKKKKEAVVEEAVVDPKAKPAKGAPPPAAKAERPPSAGGSVEDVPVVEFPNPFPKIWNEEEGTYLHICLPDDNIVNREISSRLLDKDTDIMVYVSQVFEFVNQARSKKSFKGCLIHDGGESTDTAAMVAMAYLIQYELKTLDEAYGMCLENKIDTNLNRSWMRQLMRMSDKKHGPSKHLKLRKKFNSDGVWGTSWAPYTSRFGDPADGFIGVVVATKENPEYLQGIRDIRHESLFEKAKVEQAKNKTKQEYCAVGHRGCSICEHGIVRRKCPKCNPDNIMPVLHDDHGH